MDGLKKVLALLALIVLVAAFSAPVMAQVQGIRGAQQAAQPVGQQGQAPTKDLVATIDSMPGISLFNAALKATGDDQAIKGSGPYMVFAPTDEAIQRDLGISSADALAANPDAVKNVVEGSIVTSMNVPSQESSQVTLTSINGKQITAQKSGNQIMVDGVKSVNAIPATNGIVVVTDGIV